MDYEKVKSLVNQRKIEWSAHSLHKMFEREISTQAIKQIINEGEIIEEYPDDSPFPSALIFGMWQNNPLHIVIAYDNSSEKVYIITSYKPDEHHFESDFKTRKKP